MPVKRFHGEWPLPINLLAVGWGTFMAINLAWPRKDVYNAGEPFHRYLQCVLESHRFEAAPEAVPPGPIQPAGAGTGSLE